MMEFGSACSGIEAASVAWHPLGWKTAWLAEIDRVPSQILAHNYPGTPNFGDMTQLAGLIQDDMVDAPDVFVAGTPCQSYSLAGLKGGMADPRGQLTLEYVRIANAIDEQRARLGKPAGVCVWENVPGVLRSADNAFGFFLAGLAGLAGAEEALVPEPCPANGRSSRWWRWDKKSGQHFTRWPDAGFVSGPQRAIAWRVLDAQHFGLAQRRRRVYVIASARADTDPGQLLFEFESLRRDSEPRQEYRSTEYTAYPKGRPFDMLGFGEYGFGLTASTCKARDYKDATDLVVMPDGRVRRLTVTECERLQGFPDGHTAVAVNGKPIADGPRRKAVGNSMPVTVMNWLGKRIDARIDLSTFDDI